MPSRKLTKPAKSAETNVLLDEVKSMVDVLREIEKELTVIKFSMADRTHVEAVKTELRLIRSDLAALDKKFSEEAKLAP